MSAPASAPKASGAANTAPFTPKYTNLLTMFQDSVRKYATRPLFGTKRAGQWEWITYAEFGRMVDNLRGGLASLGVGVGDRVAVIANNRVEWAATAYACFGLDAAIVPMYEAQLEKEWKYILNDCGAKVCFTANDDIQARVEKLQGEVPTLEKVINYNGAATDASSYKHLLGVGEKSPVEPKVPDDKSIATFIYTSGTTGNPKGVLLSHSNLGCNISAMQDVIPFVNDDRSLSFLPWAHSFGQVVELHGLVSLGCSMAVAESVEKIVDNLAEVQPTILFAVPRIFNRIYDGVQKQIAGKPGIIQAIFRNGMSGQSKLRSGGSLSLGEKVSLPLAKKLVFSKIVARFGGRLKYAVSGGAALSREVGEFIDNLGITVYEGYGLTETSPIASANTPVHRRIGSVGKPIPGVTVKLDHEAAEDKEQGEIVVYGHNVMQGYHNLPEENEKVFTPDGGFRTGDLGRFDKDGFLYITGRIKEQYKLENGKYVAPAALEEKLQLSPFIMQCMIHGANKLYNVAVIVPDMPNLEDWARQRGISGSPEQLLQNDKVRQLIREQIEQFGSEFKNFERVKKFVLTPEEFTTANGMLTPKMSLKRRNVLQRYEKDLDALYTE